MNDLGKRIIGMLNELNNFANGSSIVELGKCDQKTSQRENSGLDNQES